MPYHVVKSGDQYCVEKIDGGKKMGCHPTHEAANKQLAALYASEGPHGYSRSMSLLSSGYIVRKEKLNGKEHLVVPVIALVEGAVHASNAAEPEFASADEFGRWPGGWNGRPIFHGHPMRNGAAVSGNSPDVLGDSFGQVFNVRVKNRKLLMDAYVDPTKAPAELMSRISAGEPIEVSVGVFTDVEDKIGTHNGRAYKTAWKGVIPDHLALLPTTQRGACNSDMGCGVRAASETEDPEFGEVTLLYSPDQERNDKGQFGGAGHDTAAAEHAKAAEAHYAAQEAHLGATSAEKASAAERMSKEALQASHAAGAATSRSENVRGRNQFEEKNSTTMANAIGHATQASKTSATMGASQRAGHHEEAGRYHQDLARAHAKAATRARLKGYSAKEEEGDVEHMYLKWLSAGSETDELLRTLRNIPQSVRDKMPAEDFAGEDRSFPIQIAADVRDAIHAMGRARGQNLDSIKARIIAIAYRKGFVAQLPDDWKKKKDQKNASAFARIMKAIRGHVDDAIYDDIVDAVFEEDDAAVGAPCGCKDNSTQHEETDMTKEQITKFLETANPEQLKALSAVIEKPAPTVDEIKAALQKETDEKAARAKEVKDAAEAAVKALTRDQHVAALPKADQDLIAEGGKAAAAKRTETVKALVGLKRGLTEENLKDKTQEYLDTLVAAAGIKVGGEQKTDFSFQGGRAASDGQGEAVEAAPDFNAKIRAANAKRQGK